MASPFGQSPTKKTIELYSLNYYGACTLGGLLACVS
jgi:hypothetical protein